MQAIMLHCKASVHEKGINKQEEEQKTDKQTEIVYKHLAKG